MRVFLVEDHPIVREGYKRIVSGQPDMEVCGEASSAEEAFDAVLASAPDLVVLDLRLPGISGLEFVKRLTAIDFGGAILVVSGLDEALYAERAIAAGARGYLMKSESASSLIDAVRHVAEGKLYLSEALQRRLTHVGIGRGSHKITTLEHLTDRELEVFEQFGRGQTTLDIAERLGVSPKTVESHRSNIRRKLKVTHAPEFIQRAVLWVEAEASRLGEFPTGDSPADEIPGVSL